MNVQRAQEIAESAVMANVTYQGNPVFIQHVDHDKETARIYPLNESENEQVVPVHSLEEH
ncbi:small acid-soluble spore protein H [Paenibacillus prosopidis]|uniref:Small acid-soluble spore protein H (Minor) n=1 Tax=Paenibacillus prosopidis TaxID=630520 RepID=A0A368W294_9BACL|nr:small acid-soluble spore protein H [Paenibacillus prosopidis]RCW48042.1 small acid-soluble spore protein H (minor) [Paenibacillus prosopidis]